MTRDAAYFDALRAPRVGGRVTPIEESPDEALPTGDAALRARLRAVNEGRLDVRRSEGERAKAEADRAAAPKAPAP